MTRYLQITALQSFLIDLGTDETGRIQLGFNVLARKVYSTTFLEELGSQLVAEGVGVLNINIFLGTKAEIPTGSGPYLSVVETGGGPPVNNHDSAGGTAAYPQPTARLVARAKTYEAARAMGAAAFVALTKVVNQDIVP